MHGHTTFETVRRAAEDQAPIARPPPALLDASVFPVELPEAADFPLHDSAQLLLGEVLPLIRSVIGSARQIIQAYLSQSQLRSLPQVDDIPEYVANSAILALVVGFEWLRPGGQCSR